MPIVNDNQFNPDATVDSEIVTVHHATSTLLVLNSILEHTNSIGQASAQQLHSTEDILMTKAMRMRTKMATKMRTATMMKIKLALMTLTQLMIVGPTQRKTFFYYPCNFVSANLRSLSFFFQSQH